MSLSDFITGSGNLNGNAGYPAFGVTSMTPLSDTFSLSMAGDGLSGGGSLISNSTAGYAIQNIQPHGFLSGKIRCLINPVISAPANHGVFAMATSTNMSVLSGTEGYGVILDSILNQNKVQLIHITSGSSPSVGGGAGSTYTNLGESSHGVWTQNNVYSIELEWHVDIARLNGVHLIGRFGVGNDFNSLSTFAEVIHTLPNAVVGPSSGEGVFCNKSTNTLAVLFDKIQVFEMPEL